jgi:DNA invertase Pin-like site-specific DNA recombinase
VPRRRKAGDPTLAVAYLRVSTEDQRNGPEVQRRDILRWAVHEGVSVISWHCDDGVSGGDQLEDRPALAAALSVLTAKSAGRLVVQKRDRLARDVVVAASIERAALQAGAIVVAADGLGNGDDPAARLQRGILDLFAEHERAIIRARTKAALAAKRERGEMTGKPRYGFKLASDGIHVEPDPVEQSVIAKILGLRIAGSSLPGIVRSLAHSGVVSRTHRPLGLTQVARIVRASDS